MNVFRSARMLFVVSAILLGVDISAAADKAGAVTAFVQVAVVPMDRERVLENWTVVVADGRIRELGPASAVAIAGDATVIDGRGIARETAKSGTWNSPTLVLFQHRVAPAPLPLGPRAHVRKEMSCASGL